MPWQPVIDPLSYAVREGILMTGKKQRRRMESDGIVGEKTANIHTEAHTNMPREGSKKTACRKICVWPCLRGNAVTLPAFMLDFKLLLAADCVDDCWYCMNCWL